jgi:hypothetical protein
MVYYCHRHAPPGENGIHRSSQQPCPKQVPNLFWFIRTLLGSEQASDTGKINGTEGQSQDRRPLDAGKS